VVNAGEAISARLGYRPARRVRGAS
jgi:hypothetical protein